MFLLEFSRNKSSFLLFLSSRNVIVDVADPARKKFRPKYLYQCHVQQPEYSVLNFDKVGASHRPSHDRSLIRVVRFLPPKIPLMAMPCLSNLWER